jgi:hypothetical protein
LLVEFSKNLGNSFQSTASPGTRFQVHGAPHGSPWQAGLPLIFVPEGTFDHDEAGGVENGLFDITLTTT